MTIAMGINYGAYVLLAADTRVTYCNWAGRRIGFRDDSVKIQKTNSGLITGAGFVDLLDSAKTRLAQETITDTNQILKVIDEERTRYISYYDGYAGEFEQNIEKTGWLLTQ